MHPDSSSAAPDITGDVVRALVLYSLAEFQSGHAKTIRVDARGRSFSVGDDGRGHAIDRTVDGAPYLQFVYTHLDYPFAQTQGAPIQLHAIGISLANTLCAELSVTARKRNATLRIAFENGRRVREELIDVASTETGNTISGSIHPALQSADVDVLGLERWLQRVLAASAGLRIVFNGAALQTSADQGV